jgi:hypothetical protein
MKSLRKFAALALCLAMLWPGESPAQPKERPLVDKPPTERPLEDRSGKGDAAAKDDRKAAPRPDAKALPADEAALAEVDNAFRQWGATWMFDRYLPGTVRATERGLTGETYILRGTFDFARSGQRITIPFAAAYAQVKERYTLSKLCYNDVSSGMTDCIAPSDNLEARQAAAAQSRQLMGAIVLMGVAAALTESQETCVKRTNLFGDVYFECD